MDNEEIFNLQSNDMHVFMIYVMALAWSLSGPFSKL